MRKNLRKYIRFLLKALTWLWDGDVVERVKMLHIQLPEGKLDPITHKIEDIVFRGGKVIWVCVETIQTKTNGPDLISFLIIYSQFESV